MVENVAADIAAAGHSIYIMTRRLPGVRDAIYEAIRKRVLAGIEVRIVTSTLEFGKTSSIRELKAASVRFCTFYGAVYSALSVRPAMCDICSMVVIDGCITHQAGAHA